MNILNWNRSQHYYRKRHLSPAKRNVYKCSCRMLSISTALCDISGPPNRQRVNLHVCRSPASTVFLPVQSLLPSKFPLLFQFFVLPVVYSFSLVMGTRNIYGSPFYCLFRYANTTAVMFPGSVPRNRVNKFYISNAQFTTISNYHCVG